ncbi:DUF1279 domain containing protein [Nitzschia inconspicua]|uniref:DUF1279 domain containing protein n=1 Tax=Nitzschia inconspicua TaxID=303405 RepID=A0A9K3KZF9_9STRA|nr:DUF1279 domain containing protein [Nitzschia inconspicua]
MPRATLLLLLLSVAAFWAVSCNAFQISSQGTSTSVGARRPISSLMPRNLLTKEKEKTSVEETTEKYGLEVGLAQAAKERDGESAKSLLKKYGIAYLATSIPLAIVSFAICYLLVENGVDVGALLAKVGIENSVAADKAGTFAIAYAAHKAASPIRFPPTVLLTPVVAKLIGKEPEESAASTDVE